MSVYTRVHTAAHVRARQAATAPLDFTEALLMVALAVGSKALGLW
jgi:hypothetical protein